MHIVINLNRPPKEKKIIEKFDKNLAKIFKNRPKNDDRHRKFPKFSVEKDPTCDVFLSRRGDLTETRLKIRLFKGDSLSE